MSINVAALGIGEHARRNTLPALDQCASVNLKGLYSRNHTIVQEQAKKYNCIAYTRSDDLLNDPQLDAVYIATPVGLHYEWGYKVLQAGKHLWCEKSLTDSPSRSRELIEQAKQRDLCVCECFMYAHHPLFESLTHIMQGKDLGKIRRIMARFGFPHLDPDNVRYNKALGGGALLDAGCYTLHAASRLTCDRPDFLAACLGSETGYDVDTTGSALIVFTSGIYALLEWGFGHAYANEIEIWGERGRVRAERAFSKPPTIAPRLFYLKEDGTEEIRLTSPSNHFVSMFEYFSEAISNKKYRRSIWEDAERQCSLMEAVLNNSRSVVVP